MQVIQYNETEIHFTKKIFDYALKFYFYSCLGAIHTLGGCAVCDRLIDLILVVDNDPTEPIWYKCGHGLCQACFNRLERKTGITRKSYLFNCPVCRGQVRFGITVEAQS